VYKVWGRGVHLETVVDGKRVVFSYNGEKPGKKFI
jgi:stage V sporulation protein R